VPLDLTPLRRRFPGRTIVWFESAGSTMTEAARLAGEGCPSGTLVLAEEQTAGLGRLGRSWHSEKEAGLYASVVLRLPLAPDGLPVVALALGLAVQEAIQHCTGVICDLRWPNDVLVGGRKCAGILVQLQDGALIAGIGINVNHAAFPAELAGIATSLRMVSGGAHAREHLLVNLLEAVDVFTKILVEDGREQILNLYSRASSYVRGRRVQVDQGSSSLAGTTEGLDPSGFLIVRSDSGARQVILAGGVRPI